MFCVAATGNRKTTKTKAVPRFRGWAANSSCSLVFFFLVLLSPTSSSSNTIVFASAEEIVIDWIIKSYDPMTAKVGDTMRFDFKPSHNVYLHPSGSCDTSGSTLVGDTTGATYTFTNSDVGKDLTFVCQKIYHCSSGQIMTVSVTDDVTSAPSASPSASPSLAPSLSAPPSVTSPPTPVGGVATDAPSDAPSPPPSVGANIIELAWSIRPYDDVAANVGDRVVFNWSAGHNVYIHPTHTCDTSNRELVGLEGGASYTFTEDDAAAGKLTFACDQPFHCAGGQIVTFVLDGSPTTGCCRGEGLVGRLQKLLLSPF